MAFFGPQNSGGLFGNAGQQQPRAQIIGVSSSLIALDAQAKLARISINSLSADQRSAQFGFDNSPAVIPPWQLPEETSTITEQIREVRELTSFIDLNDPNLDAVADDVDQTATFVLFNALTNLRVLAEYAAEDNTLESSLGRLDEQFRSGLSEVRDYLSSTELDKLDLFLGDKEYNTEASTRTGRNDTETNGSFVADNPDNALAGLTGTEVFTVSIEKSGVTDDITIDLSGLSGTLSLNNIKDYINTQIEALTDTNSNGDEFVKHQTRFDVTRNGTTGRYGLQIEGTITEEVSLSAAVAEPTLYAVSAVSQLDDSFAVTSRITEFNNIDGTIVVDDTTSFAAIDYEATEIKGLVSEEEDDNLDPAIASLRDQFLSDAAADVTSSNNTDSSTSSNIDTDNTSSITNVNSDDRVNADTTGSRVAVDSQGGIYVVGTSTGSFGHQLNAASTQDVFLTKFDTEGNVVFSRLLGASDSAEAFAITVDSQDNVIIAGATNSALSTADVVEGGGTDAFVTKISKRGDEVFRYQLDTFATTAAYALAVDSNNDIYVGGSTSSAISATSGFAGGNDALVLKLNGTSGALTDSTVFGTSGNDVIRGLAVDGNNDLIAAVEQAGDASVVRISSSNLANQTASVNLGSLGGGGEISNLSIDTTNSKVYVSGVTTNATLNASGAATVNETASGGLEGFVSGLSFSGTSTLSADFTTYLSTSGTDSVADVTVNGGKVYVAGSTNGTLSGEQARGSIDGFVARIDGTSGALEDTQQYGESLASSNVGGIAFTNRGDSVLETLGLPTGLIEGDQTLDVQTQTSARVGDFFYIRVNDGLRQKIELEEGDTFNTIKRKLNVASIGKVDAEVSNTSEGEKLKVSTFDDGVSIDLIPGSGDRDLLSRIGLEPGKLLPKNEVFDLGNDEDIPPEEDLGGVFGLGLGGALNLQDKATARYVLGLLDNAIATTQRAFRSTRFDPIKQQLLNQSRLESGAPSARTLSQIANFQTGLARLQSGASSPTLSLFA